jgi:hypothetical protein
MAGCNHNNDTNSNQTHAAQDASSPHTMPIADPYDKVKAGMKYAEVLALLGRKPDAEIGSGTSYLTYKISPSQELVIWTTGTGAESTVLDVCYKEIGSASSP